MFITTSNQHSPRIATYSQDGLGLGHMRRTHSIASQFLRMRPDASVLTLSDSQLGQFFTPAPNHDYLKLPSIVKDGPGQWRATNLNMPFNQVSELRQEIIYHTLTSFRPQILLVDHMPHGAMGELVPTLQALRASGETQIVLGLRDILDAPQVVQNRWQVEGAYAAVEQYYDRVLVYGMSDVFDLAEQYIFSPCLASRLRYTGYVCAPAKTCTGKAIRSRFLRGSHACAKLVVAMAGGGADAYPMMRTLVEALPAIQHRQHTLLVLVAGPFMPVEMRQDLQGRASGLPVRVLASIDDTYGYLQAADLVVAMAGYNTSMEILQTGKRAIFVPRCGPSAEQRTRARLFADRGWVDMLDPDDLQPNALASMVLKNLSLGAHVAPREKPDLHGLQEAADQLLSLLPGSMQTATHSYANEEVSYELVRHRS